MNKNILKNSLILLVISFPPLRAEDGTSQAQRALEQYSVKEIDDWCESAYKKAVVDYQEGRCHLAHRTWNQILFFRPHHEKTLEKIGFKIEGKGVRPIESRLLESGWGFAQGRWKPVKEFDHDRLSEVTQSIRNSMDQLGTRFGKKEADETLHDDLVNFKNGLQEAGPTAVPELMRQMRKGSTRGARTLALASLALFRPYHLEEELLANYPRMKDDGQAAASAAVLASILPGVPKKMARKIESGNPDEATRVCQLAAMMNEKALTPRIEARWKIIQEQQITQPGGARNVITLAQQQAYVRDLTAVVNVGVGLFDPDIGYIQSGSVLDVRVIKVEIFRAILEKLQGAREMTPEDETAINKEVFERP